MSARFYFADTDENGVLCVDQIDSDSQTEASVVILAESYPGVIYFKVDNAVPEFRVPR